MNGNTYNRIVTGIARLYGGQSVYRRKKENEKAAMKYFSILVLLISAFALVGCVTNRQVAQLNNRVSVLERQNRELLEEKKRMQEQYDSQLQDSDKALRGKAAGLSADIIRLGEEVQALRGRVEEAEHAARQKDGSYQDLVTSREERFTRLDEMIRQNREKIAVLEQYLDFETTGRGPGAGTEPANGKKQLSEEEIYQAAKAAFDTADYDTAREGFEKLLKRYPNSQNADNAQFWIGEIYYRQKWYEKAILEYQSVIEKYPKGNKVQASLLKQGFSFFHLGDKANARLIFQELNRKYPDSNEAAIAREKLKTIEP